MMLFISFFTGLTVSLNRYANDKIHCKIKPTIYYLSELLISLICGFALGLTSKAFFKESFEIWLVCSCVGSYLGKKSINLICGIILIKLHIPEDIMEDINDEIDDGISKDKDE